MAGLVATKGPRAGESVEVGKEATLGRGLDVDIQLDDLTVSRRHARLYVNDKGGYILEDLDSGNGTFLNGRQIESEQLRDGDEIRIGRSSFVLDLKREGKGESGALEPTLLQVDDQDETSSTVVNTLDVDSREARQETTEASTVEQMSKANRRLRTVLDIFEAVAMNLNEQELLERILDRLFEVFPETHRGFIVLRDPDTGRLTPRATRAIGAADPGRLEVSKSITQFVLDKKQAVLSRDAMEDSRFGRSESIMDFQLRSVMCAPLKEENQVIGFILVDTQRVASNYDEEGLALLAGIANQASLAIANARLHGKLLARGRLEQDLRNARRIQHSFLPQSPPSVPGYRFVDWYDSASEVGGDFYDFIVLPNDKVGIVVGDVSGKGIPAALMMAKMSGQVRVHAVSNLEPAEILAELNKVVLQGETETFVTIAYMSLDCRNHTITLANAGHLPPLAKRSDGSVEKVEGGDSFPVGIVEDAEFPQITFGLADGEMLCVFTDGIIEAMDAKNEQFGYDRLIDIMKESPPDPEVTVRNVQQAILKYTAGVKQSDDLTLVCFGLTD